MNGFAGKNIWIIGGSTGIGLAVAQKFSLKGANIAISSRDTKSVDEAVKSLSPSVKHHGLPLDATDYDALIKARDKLISQWGTIDMMIYAAGLYKAMRADNIDLPVAKKIFEVNFQGCFNSVAAIVPHFISRKSGTIVNVSSVAGFRGLPNSLLYGASKAAMTNFTETLYIDLKPYGIAVHVVHPGFVKTRLTDQNEFKMPALIGADEAADEILNGIEKGCFDIHFPKRFTYFMKMLRILPYRLYFWVTSKFTGL